MSQYLTAELAKIGVDDEAIVEYCAGLLTETSMDDEEKQEAIVGYLEAVVDSDTSGIVSKAIELTAKEHAQHKAEDEQRAKEELDRAQERERIEFQRDMEQVKHEERQLTSEERKQRDNLLKKYGGGELEVVEKNGEAEIVYREVKNTMRSEGNNNAKIVADKERASRENAKLAHQKKVEKEKELLEKDRLRKDKEKRRTMKKEKRRM
ncbi:hypothetical protein IWW50_000800 [Coemansia erecta]|nr:hypothetical protein GGF43_000559 [Coemansia sp. RSA 2618]KAJ2829531.1 hypothetical protein IWW50_000800 [Coemansia erecta]